MPITPRLRLILLLLGPVSFALLAIALGKKTGWDLFNYHWYNPFALLNDRFGFDIAVGHHATYYNPLADVPLYLIASIGPAWLGGVFLGAMAGIAVSLIGAIAYYVLPIADERHRTVAAALLALLGAFGAGAFQEIGDPANDIPAAIGSFAALLVVVCRFERLQRSTMDNFAVRTLLIAGICAGGAVGLKLTTAVYAVGIAAALVTIRGTGSIRGMRTLVFGLGTIVGMAICGGFWMLRLWQFSGNPFFPYFNDVFHSPLLATTGYLDPSFRPDNWTVRLLFPFFFTVDSHYASESAFRDAHILALYVLIPLSALLALAQRFRAQANIETHTIPFTGFLFAFAGASYLAWLVIFDIYRYLIPLEMLSPLLTAMAFATWPMPTSARVVATILTLAALQAVVRIDLHDRQSWSGSYVEVQVPTLPDPSHTMILMTGHEPVAFAIPSFPRRIPFLRIDGWLVQASDRSTGLARSMRERVSSHRGPLYVLHSTSERDSALSAAANYGLSLDFDDSRCMQVTSNIANPLSLCPVVRTTGS